MADSDASREVGRGPAGEEHLRFIRNFHDVFLSIGIAMFAGGLGIVSALVLAQLLKGMDHEHWRAAAGTVLAVALLDAAVMWGLAEVFARSRRLFLPAIVLLQFFLLFLFGAIVAAYALVFFGGAPEDIRTRIDAEPLFPLWFTGLTALATLVYYLRMRLPFAIGQFGAWLAFAFSAAVFSVSPETARRFGDWITLAGGLGLFAAALVYDARDPERATRLSDNAFWLHFAAAPLIFSATTGLVTKAFGAATGGVAWAVAVLGVVLAFAVVSLVINRRALVVAGLLTAIFATGILLQKTGLGGAWVAGLTLLLLGGMMVLLGGGWRSARKAILRGFPKSGWIARIAPPEALAAAR